MPRSEQIGLFRATILTEEQLCSGFESRHDLRVVSVQLEDVVSDSEHCLEGHLSDGNICQSLPQFLYLSLLRKIGKDGLELGLVGADQLLLLYGFVKDDLPEGSVARHIPDRRQRFEHIVRHLKV